LAKLPVVSGVELLKLLTSLGYEVVRQKGSHVQLRKATQAGDHNITVPLHDDVAKGTLGDILSKVSIWCGISKDDLIEMLDEV